MYRIKTVLKVEMDIIISTEARPIGQAAILYNYSHSPQPKGFGEYRF
jgi:hypothetical protein